MQLNITLFYNYFTIILYYFLSSGKDKLLLHKDKQGEALFIVQ